MQETATENELANAGRRKFTITTLNKMADDWWKLSDNVGMIGFERFNEEMFTYYSFKRNVNNHFAFSFVDSVNSVPFCISFDRKLDGCLSADS